jgi:glycosyltransferase involved in cell wall biosynthesis
MYFINWNDRFYLHYIAQHYGKFCSKIVMYDNHSTDGSQSIAKSFGFEVRTFGNVGELNDQHYLDVKNHCWKEERGKSDYVIVCDADEFLSDPSGLELGSLPLVKGFDMFSNELPKDSIFDIKTGFESESYSKQIIFSPLVREINYVHGCHLNHAQQDSTPSPLKMYHYRGIGGFERLMKRHEQYIARMSQFNKIHRMGYQYLFDREQKERDYNACLSKSTIVI